MWKPRAITSSRRASSRSRASAGGQEEPPCEVKSSTTRGRGSALAPDEINNRPPSIAHVIGCCENLVMRSSSNCDQSMRRRYAARARAAAANPKRATGHISTATTPASRPFNRTLRAARTKWVSGNTSPIPRAQPGIPWKGNMKPDKEHRGEIEEYRTLHRLHLAFHQRGEGEAQDQIGGRINGRCGQQRPDAASRRQIEEQLGKPDGHYPPRCSDDDIRRQLADRRIQRVYRRRQKRLPAAALALTDKRQRPQHQHADHDDDADQPRDDRPGCASLGIVKPIDVEGGAIVQ